MLANNLASKGYSKQQIADFRDMLWLLYFMYEDHKLFNVNFFIFKKTVRVRDIKPLIELFVGPYELTPRVP